MTNKILFYLLSLVAFPAALSAQTVSVGANLPMRPVKRTVYDSARVKVYYEYAFLKDSTRTDKITAGQTVLLVGDKFTGFTDYGQLVKDSIYDAYCREGKSSSEYMLKGFSLKSKVCDYSLIRNLSDNDITVRYDNTVLSVQYTEPAPSLQWTLAVGDSIISGVKCRKATCRFGGRNWTAWYSPEYSMPFGPYKFGGLPGLVFLVSDDRHNHTFTLNGIETCSRVCPIYLSDETGVVKTSEEKFRTAVANYHKDPETAMTAKYPGTVFPEDLKGKHQSIPYNPIELE